jgi:hypothetical protein
LDQAREAAVKVPRERGTERDDDILRLLHSMGSRQETVIPQTCAFKIPPGASIWNAPVDPNRNCMA